MVLAFAKTTLWRGKVVTVSYDTLLDYHRSARLPIGRLRVREGQEGTIRGRALRSISGMVVVSRCTPLLVAVGNTFDFEGARPDIELRFK
jgi:hypothetical protein